MMCLIQLKWSDILVRILHASHFDELSELLCQLVDFLVTIPSFFSRFDSLVSECEAHSSTKKMSFPVPYSIQGKASFSWVPFCNGFDVLRPFGKGFTLSKRGLALSRMILAAVAIYDYALLFGGIYLQMDRRFLFIFRKCVNVGCVFSFLREYVRCGFVFEQRRFGSSFGHRTACILAERFCVVWW